MNSDTPQHYGRISRALHWSMAALLLLQFISALAHYAFEDSAFEALFWPWHKPLGFLLLVLLLLRLVWAFVQRAQRPPPLNPGVRLGHLGLYLLLALVPVLGLLRQYGSGRGFEPFGLPLMRGFEGDKIDWMVDLGSLLHGELGWALLLLIFGHVLMVWWHRREGAGRDVWPRMWGPRG